MGIGNKDTIYDLVNRRPIPENFDPSKPFRLVVDKITDTEDTSIIAHGYVESGVVNIGDSIKIEGLDKVAKVYEIRIHYTDKRVNVHTVRQGDRVRLTLRGVDKHLIRIGKVLYK